MKFKCIRSFYGLEAGEEYEAEITPLKYGGIEIYSFLNGKVKLSNETISRYMKKVED